jgi:hypothetical protein
MGYPAATGRSTSSTDATHARDLAPTAFRRRKSSGISRRQEVGSSSRSTGIGRLFVSTRRESRSGEMRGRGESPAQKHGAVCADCLAIKRTARASNVFIGTAALPPITHESPAAAPIRGLEKASCRPLAAPNSRIKGMGSRVE